MAWDGCVLQAYCCITGLSKPTLQSNVQVLKQWFIVHFPFFKIFQGFEHDFEIVFNSSGCMDLGWERERLHVAKGHYNQKKKMH